MTKKQKQANRLWKFVQEYCENARKGFEDRWSQVKPDIYEKHTHEVIGGLLSRQTTLSIELAKAPSMWNGHVAPLILRCMIDAYITLAWILDKPTERSTKYVHYGLGQEKLFIEYLEEDSRENPNGPDEPDVRKMIDVRKSWLNSQLAEWATEVNVGSWSGMTTREMAKEVGRESIYKFAYMPFSGPAHNMWQHVGIYNVEPCTNSLHKHHLVPKVRDVPMHPDFMYRSAKYLTQTFELFDSKVGVTSKVQLPIDFFVNHELFSGSREGEDDTKT